MVRQSEESRKSDSQSEHRSESSPSQSETRTVSTSSSNLSLPLNTNSNYPVNNNNNNDVAYSGLASQYDLNVSINQSMHRVGSNENIYQVDPNPIPWRHSNHFDHQNQLNPAPCLQQTLGNHQTQFYPQSQPHLQYHQIQNHQAQNHNSSEVYPPPNGQLELWIAQQSHISSQSQLGIPDQFQLPSQSQLGIPTQSQIPSQSQTGIPNQPHSRGKSHLGIPNQSHIPSQSQLGIPDQSQIPSQSQIRGPHLQCTETNFNISNQLNSNILYHSDFDNHNQSHYQSPDQSQLFSQTKFSHYSIPSRISEPVSREENTDASSTDPRSLASRDFNQSRDTFENHLDYF